MPPGVTLAFAPYANDVQNWVTQRARRAMKCCSKCRWSRYDFPDSDPGQYTLRAGVGEDANTKRLVWALTRFTGYAGVTNLLGGRLLSDADALEPVLTYLTRRGLLFYDNGSALHSVAPDVAARVGVPFRAGHADDRFDPVGAWKSTIGFPSWKTEARAKGSASGSGFLYPVTVERVQHGPRALPAGALFWCPYRP